MNIDNLLCLFSADHILIICSREALDTAYAPQNGLGSIATLEVKKQALGLWLFFKSKSQFRFKGKMKELKENMKYWDSLSDKSKSTWFWQHPGKEINKNVRTSQIISNDLNKPESFVVLEFEIYSVDLLKLVTPIHKRYVWRKENNWSKIIIERKFISKLFFSISINFLCPSKKSLTAPPTM